ncbi:MAG TPA: TolC family outer membrane protein [Acetobacteraceae bacterium]|nr:TolC family outer membrane protein [Acetobacteraceae bacterium]
MISRHALVFGIGVALAGSAAAQPAGHRTTPPPGKPASARSGGPGSGGPRTLTGALAATYANQPALQAERAKLRATDENLPTALAGWRPTVVLAGTAGYGDGVSRSYNVLIPGWQKLPTERDIATAQATVTQPIYNGGRTQANVNRAKDQVMAERASLIAQEQTSFTNTVNAYVGVIQAQDLLALNINNEQVLAKQLQATNDRFRVGEITRTDVAQAEAALAGATAQRQTAEGNLATARATFVQIVGYDPPRNLIEPQPLALPVRAEHEATVMASTNNPNVVAAQFNDSAAKDAVDVAFSQLMPQVSLQGQTFDQENSGGRSNEGTGYQVVAQVSVPLYQGGAEYSAVRQAKQSEQQTARLVADAQRTAVQAAVQSWETLAAATSAAASTRSQIRADEVALEGVEREAIVGSRTTLDVLNAQQALLNSRVTLVQNLAQLVTASYQVAAAIGRLTARDLRLPVPLYDDTAYYNAVKNKWFGLGDYATGQPGR